MENKFQCPPAFDVNAARVYMIAPKFKDQLAGKPNISVKTLNGKQRPGYLSALGKIWKEMPRPAEIMFEEVVHDYGRQGNHLKHFHTEFNLLGRAIHIDYVNAWSYGPGTHQTHVGIYLDGNLATSAIRGGGCHGGNWQRRWPATLVVEGLLLRFTTYMDFEKGRLQFKPGDKGSPLVLYKPVRPEAVPFRVFDLTDATFMEQVIPSVKLDRVDHLFYQGASDDDKKTFLSELLQRGHGHFISDEALGEMVALEIFSNCLGLLKKCVFKEKGGTIENADFELNEYRTRELTNYVGELLLSERA